MKRFGAAAVAASVLLGLGAPAALAGPAQPPQAGSKKEKLLEVQLLAFNDFHVHLEANTPGTIVNPATGPPAIPAGGAEYFARHVAQLRAQAEHTFVVSAGDLINASPLLSGLFHDEPTIEFMNLIGLDYNGVGNHEFDDGT